MNHREQRQAIQAKRMREASDDDGAKRIEELLQADKQRKPKQPNQQEKSNEAKS